MRKCLVIAFLSFNVLAGLLIGGSVYAQTENKQVQLSVTIAPLLLIGAAITDGVSVPTLILEAEQDHHHPVLRPSQRKALNEADVLLWIGPNMEGTLSKVIESLTAEIITATELKGQTKHRILNDIDPHIWLDTNNAKVIATALTQALQLRDAENINLYQNNLNAFEKELTKLSSDIRESLRIKSIKKFAVYHNAFQYYEKQFGLEHLVSFTDDEELKPTIRQLLKIRKTLEENEVNCILVEPEINTEQLSNVIDNKDMRYVSIDVLGRNISVEKNGYINLMHSITNAMIECLQ